MLSRGLKTTFLGFLLQLKYKVEEITKQKIGYFLKCVWFEELYLSVRHTSKFMSFEENNINFHHVQSATYINILIYIYFIKDDFK